MQIQNKNRIQSILNAEKQHKEEAHDIKAILLSSWKILTLLGLPKVSVLSFLRDRDKCSRLIEEPHMRLKSSENRRLRDTKSHFKLLNTK